MSGGGIRAGLAIFLIGLLLVWLIRPIGNPCPDVDKLPDGSTGSSAPSLAPPLTRICTYSTPDGTRARKRYLPLIDLVALLFVAAVGGAIGRAARGRRESGPPRVHRPQGTQRSGGAPAPPPEAAAEQARRERDVARPERDAAQPERDADERDRARQERQARRRG
jgi:hypothetical protein